MTEVLTYHPLVNRMKNQVKELKKILLGLLDDWQTMQNVLQPQLLYLYEQNFGELEKQIKEKTRIAAILDRKIKLFAIKIHRGERITQNSIEFVNKIVDLEFKEKFSQNGNQIEKNISENEIENEDNIKELSNLYRSLVKKLHPDIAGDSELYKKYWVSIQDAYKNKDLNRLRIFYQSLFTDLPDIDIENDNSYIQRLKSEIQQLELSIGIEKRKIERLRNQEPFIYEKKIKDNIWIALRRDRLKEKLKLIERQINSHEKLLRNITGVESIELNPHKKAIENEKFQEEFFHEAYFNHR